MIRRVEKRDGRLVPFDKQKISAAVAKAQAAVGERDPQFAGEVGDVVEMALARRYGTSAIATPAAGPSGSAGGDSPGIEEIQDLVEQALIELGRAAVAKAYILYRDRRARIRAALEVASSSSTADGTAAADAARRAPKVELATGVSAWSKGRIVGALMNEADLSRTLAEEVASRVEARVFDSGWKRISTALIRELVDNELVDLGLAQALRRQRPVGLPRHDLRAILAGERRRAPGGGETGGRAEAVVAGEVLRRYVLEDVLDGPAAGLHLAGEIELVQLARAHQALTLAVPSELLLRGEPGAQAGFAVLGELAELAERTAEGVVVEDAATLVHALLRGSRAPAGRTSPLAHFLTALAALARASGRRIDLALAPCGPRAMAPSEDPPEGARVLRPAAGDASPGTGPLVPRPAAGASAPARSTALGPLAVHARLIEELELQEREGTTGLARLYADAGDLVRLLAGAPTLRGTVDRLLAGGRLFATFGSPAERFAAPGLARAGRERGALALAAAVAINLPRAARRAGPWCEDALLEHLSASVESALEALAAVERFQRTLAACDPRPAALRGRSGYALAPVGLREALRTLGDGEISPEAGARVLAFLAEAAQRFGAARGMQVHLSPCFGEEAASRFAALDAELFQVRQPLLFEADARALERGLPYTEGFDLGPAQPARAAMLGAGEAALLASLRSGLVHPPAMLAGRGPADERAEHAAQLERLERRRERLRSGAHALYALPGRERPSGPGAGDLYAPLAEPPEVAEESVLAGPSHGAPLRTHSDDR